MLSWTPLLSPSLSVKDLTTPLGHTPAAALDHRKNFLLPSGHVSLSVHNLSPVHLHLPFPGVGMGASSKFSNKETFWKSSNVSSRASRLGDIPSVGPYLSPSAIDGSGR